MTDARRPMSGGNDKTIVLTEERADVTNVVEQTGTVRARKTVETVPYEQTVSRGVEHAELERGPVLEGDSGQVETLPDGSVSIPVFEEQVVVTKRLVVRERIVLRKHSVYEEQVVQTDLRREHVAIEAEGDLQITDQPSPNP